MALSARIRTESVGHRLRDSVGRINRVVAVALAACLGAGCGVHTTVTRREVETGRREEGRTTSATALLATWADADALMLRVEAEDTCERREVVVYDVTRVEERKVGDAFALSVVLGTVLTGAGVGLLAAAPTFPEEQSERRFTGGADGYSGGDEFTQTHGYIVGGVLTAIGAPWLIAATVDGFRAIDTETPEGELLKPGDWAASRCNARLVPHAAFNLMHVSEFSGSGDRPALVESLTTDGNGTARLPLDKLTEVAIQASPSGTPKLWIVRDGTGGNHGAKGVKADIELPPAFLAGLQARREQHWADVMSGHLGRALAAIKKRDFATARAETKACERAAPASPEPCRDANGLTDCEEMIAKFPAAGRDEETWQEVVSAWEAMERRRSGLADKTGPRTEGCYKQAAARFRGRYQQAMAFIKSWEADRPNRLRREWRAAIGQCMEFKRWWISYVRPKQVEILRLQARGEYDRARALTESVTFRIQGEEGRFNLIADKVRRIMGEIQDEGASEAEIRRMVRDAEQWCVPAS
ncbi:MAG: hypothetical protein AMXMBFR64_39460 [Myxococcales bacterium]